MEPEKSMPPQENFGILPGVTEKPYVSKQKAKPEDFSQICRTASITSFSSSSVSTEPKDPKCGNKDHSDMQTSQTSDISMEESPRSSMNQALKSEKAFIEYVMSLPAASFPKDSPQIQTKTAVVPCIRPKPKPSFIATNTSNVTKVGLDHLDNLCKLMEQLSELKDTNTKLQKRVQYLEDLKTLHEMHKEIRREVQYGSESVLNQRRQMGLKKSLTGTDCISAVPRGSADYAKSSPRQGQGCFKEQRASKSARSPSGRRSRGQSTSLYDGHRRERSKSVGHEEAFDSKSKRIFPKWSKVKEAFGWESERKNSEKSSKFYIGTSITQPGNTDQFQKRIFSEQDSAALRIPLYCDYSEKEEMNFMDTYAGEAMVSVADGSIPPFNSSAEDISSMFETYRNSSYMKPKSLTIERDMDPEQAFAKFEKEESKKSHKSPWGRVKTIIERRRDSLKRRHLRRGPQSSITQYRDPGAIDDIDYESQEICYDPLRKSSVDQFIPNPNLSKLESRSSEDPERTSKRKILAKDGEKERIRDTTSASQAERTHNSDSCIRNVQEREVMFRTPGSSPQFHRKSTWMKMKNVLRSKKEGDSTPILSSQSMPSSPNGVHDGTFDFEETEALDDNQEETEDFGSGHEITRVGSDSYVHKLSSDSVPVSDIMLKLQRNISDDFNRKMQQWERIRNSGIRPTTTSPKWERKNSGSKSRKKTKADRLEKSPKPKVKDLSWLEKELQKIEKEKQRLSKEKEKYEERAVRLERLRQTVLTARNSNKKEVLVRTSAGEFRFEGISDAFTKKLYEWETKRGFGPELSTIALLDSSLESASKNCLNIQPIEKYGNLQRGLSRSESSLADIGQPSHTSSNSLPSLKPADISDLEKVHQHSRANSEPDLSSFVGKGNNVDGQSAFVKIDDLTASSSRDTLGAVPGESYANPEVTRLIDSDVEEVLGQIESQRQEQRDENYYSLLEENVILLEQLKNKEEICRRLEKELELLDDKVEEMGKHHQQEMERYREKLWEMHKPGSTPREVQGCLQVMVQLRSRIENLEKCTEKLKNEKETLEDSFRFHSAEQEHMTLDLLDKMRELHAAGGDGKKKGRNKDHPQANFDIKIVERLQDLSSQLVKQTQELEQALAERTRQICQLRWELLHRDVSSVKLETELHSAQMQSTNVQGRVTCDDKRSKYAHFRSWSSEEASNRSRQLQECSPKSKKRLKAELPSTYYKLPKTDFQTTELSNTVHELNRELIRLSTAAESFLNPEGVTHDEESLVNKEAITWPEGEDLQEFALPSEPINIAAMTFNHKNEMRNAKISVRRNSAGSVSVASGMELGGSENSSVNDDSHRYVHTSKPSPKLYSKPTPTASWTDSESSTEEEDFTKVVSFSTRPDKPSSTIWKTDYDAKHPHIRRKVFHEVENEKYADILNMDEKLEHDTKKKNDLKFPKKTPNWNSQILPVLGHTIQHCSSTQSESDTVSKTDSPVNAKSSQNRATNNGNALTLRNFSYSFPLTKSSDNTKNTAPFKPESLTRRNIQKKEGASRSQKSHSVRTAASDSKIPKCNKINIKKSESCRESKKDREIISVTKVNLSLSKKDISKTKLGSFKRKNSSSEVKDNTCTIPILSSTMRSSDCDKKMKPECILSKFLDSDYKKKEFQEGKINDKNKHSLDSQAHKQTPTMPQISVKRRQFSLQKQAHSISEKKKSRKGFLDETDESSDEDDQSSPKENIRSQCKKESINDRQVNETSMSTFVLKLPRRKQKIPPSVENFSSEQKSTSSERDSIQNDSENSVTVTIPKRTHLKAKKMDSMENNTKLSMQSESSNFCQYDTYQVQKSSSKTLFASSIPQKHDVSSTEQRHCNNISLEYHANNLNQEKTSFNPVDNVPLILRPNTDKTTHLDNETLHKSSQNSINHVEMLIKSSNSLHGSSLGEKQPEGKTEKSSSYYKSPSAPQLDWKKTCAKKISREGAPNVKTLIEKYNQRVLEAQSPRSPCSSAYNSPATSRKALPETIPHQMKNIPFPDTSQNPKIFTTAAFYNPLTFKGNNIDIFPSPTTSPPTSPSSKARSEALLKAKEKFISSTNIFNVTSDNLQETHTSDQKTIVRPNPEICNTTKRSATDTEVCGKQNIQCFFRKTEEQINRQSICSNKSCDSMSLVLCKTGETCQESRLSKRSEKQKTLDSHSKALESNFKPSKSLSNSSIFKSVTGYDLKLPSSFLRLRRSRKKKDMSTVSELCRQSLLLSGNEAAFIPDETIPAKSARSCPSSPELKPKGNSKTSWFQRSLFRLK